jgi:Putative peptidoglycan binding domain/HlyD family secretion protein
MIATVVIVLVAAVAITVVVAGVNPFAHKHSSHSSADSASSVSTSLASVTQRDLSSQTQVSATLGYAAGNYAIVYQGGGSGASSGTGGGSAGGGPSGTFTKLPSVGTVVRQGQVLYRVNNNPVVLLYGTTPAYRSLSEGTNASDATGPDVAELNADLVALGYATHTQIPARSDEFSWETKHALEKLQHHLGLDETGTLKLGQVVFLPSAARVTSVSASVGGPAQTGSTVLAASSTTRQVRIALDTSQQTYVKVGDKVTITLPNNQTTPGVVSSVGTVARSSSGSGSGSSSSGSSSNPTITVLIRPTHPAATGTWDQAPVNVTITTATVPNALVVPVTALLVKAGGGYAVEVAAADGTHHLVDVTLGVFDDADGLVQVTGSGLAAGQRVVVPTA